MEIKLEVMINFLIQCCVGLLVGVYGSLKCLFRNSMGFLPTHEDTTVTYLRFLPHGYALSILILLIAGYPDMRLEIFEIPFWKLLHRNSLSSTQILLHVSASCAVLTVLLAMLLLALHISCWTKPKEQKKITVIIFMAPVYGVLSYFSLSMSLSHPHHLLVFLTLMDSTKEFYESVVMLEFLNLMHTYVNNSIQRSPQEDMQRRWIKHYFPMTYFQPPEVRLDEGNLMLIKDWVGQFCIIRLVCGILMFGLQTVDLYPSWVGRTFWGILFISSSLAFYALAIFYETFRVKLAPHRPLWKFMLIKGIVFCSFWQEILIWFLVYIGAIGPEHEWSNGDYVKDIYQNFLISVEMLIVSIVQVFIYPPL